MYKVKRTIYVDNQSIDVWFGLSNITSKETAVRKAIEYTKELFHNILISQKNNNKSQEDNGKKSQS